MVSHALMFNWIGEMPPLSDALGIPGVHWHDYGKQARPGRKIGHATLTSPSMDELRGCAERLASIAGGEFPALLKQVLTRP